MVTQSGPPGPFSPAPVDDYYNPSTPEQEWPFEYPWGNVVPNRGNILVKNLGDHVGGYFLKVPAGLSGLNEDHVHTYFAYFTHDGNSDSKESIQFEPIRYFYQSDKFYTVEGGRKYWYIYMPETFLINGSWQPGKEHLPIADTWNIGGNYLIDSRGYRENVKGHLPKRSWEYAERFAVPRTRYNSGTHEQILRESWYRSLMSILP